MRRALPAAALLLAAALPAAAAADAIAAEPFPVAVVGAVEGGPVRVTETVLVGRAGQLYHPAGDRTWRRRDSGGIASAVVGAVRGGPGGAVYAVADRPPLYRYRDRAWHAFPLPNRGLCAVAVGGALPAITIHRHIYLLGERGWSRLGSAPERVIALWAAAPGQVVVSDETGALGRMHPGGAVRPIRHPLEADDRVLFLAGAPGKELFAVARSGAVLRVGGAAAAPIPRAPELAGFTPHAAGAAADGAVWIAGALEATDAPPIAALARVERGRLVLAESFEALAPGDRFAVVRAESGGALLLVTAAGDVRLRDGSGAWQRGRVSGQLPEGEPRQFSRAGPAQSR